MNHATRNAQRQLGIPGRKEGFKTHGDELLDDLHPVGILVQLKLLEQLIQLALYRLSISLQFRLYILKLRQCLL